MVTNWIRNIRCVCGCVSFVVSVHDVTCVLRWVGGWLREKRISLSTRCECRWNVNRCLKTLINNQISGSQDPHKTTSGSRVQITSNRNKNNDDNTCTAQNRVSSPWFHSHASWYRGTHKLQTESNIKQSLNHFVIEGWRQQRGKRRFNTPHYRDRERRNGEVSTETKIRKTMIDKY